MLNMNKLARTFAAQVEALKKYRSAGEQTIKVQHATVNDGGQAIVGNVNQGELGVQQKMKANLMDLVKKMNTAPRCEAGKYAGSTGRGAGRPKARLMGPGSTATTATKQGRCGTITPP